MTNSIIQPLILKDWYLSRGVIWFCIAAGALALLAIRFGGEAAFYIGSVLLITVVSGLGIYLVIATIVNERKEQTLPFIMSLPVSAMGYTTAKILSNLLIFLVPWTALAIGTFIVIGGRDALPNGIMPFAAIVLVELFVGYCLILAVAIVSESEGLTIGAIVFIQLIFSFFLYVVARIPSIAATLEGSVAAWSPTVLRFLAAELATIVVLLGLTFYLQSRKRDFL